MSYGFTCYGCETNIEFDDLPDDPVKEAREAEKRAGKQGWGIGHFNGQGHIVCGDCENAVWDYSRFPGRRP